MAFHPIHSNPSIVSSDSSALKIGRKRKGSIPFEEVVTQDTNDYKKKLRERRVKLPPQVFIRRRSLLAEDAEITAITARTEGGKARSEEPEDPEVAALTSAMPIDDEQLEIIAIIKEFLSQSRQHH